MTGWGYLIWCMLAVFGAMVFLLWGLIFLEAIFRGDFEKKEDDENEENHIN